MVTTVKCNRVVIGMQTVYLGGWLRQVMLDQVHIVLRIAPNSSHVHVASLGYDGKAKPMWRPGMQAWEKGQQS